MKSPRVRNGHWPGGLEKSSLFKVEEIWKIGRREICRGRIVQVVRKECGEVELFEEKDERIPSRIE